MANKTLKIPGKKIISVGPDMLDEYDLDKIKVTDLDLFVYAYKHGGYEGSGIAIGRMKGGYFYHELGHCSCDGPMRDLYTSVKSLLPIRKVFEVVRTNYNYDELGVLVINEMKKHI